MYKIHYLTPSDKEYFTKLGCQYIPPWIIIISDYTFKETIDGLCNKEYDTPLYFPIKYDIQLTGILPIRNAGIICKGPIIMEQRYLTLRVCYSYDDKIMSFTDITRYYNKKELIDGYINKLWWQVRMICEQNEIVDDIRKLILFMI